jgi:hypothetical protein
VSEQWEPVLFDQTKQENVEVLTVLVKLAAEKSL